MRRPSLDRSMRWPLALAALAFTLSSERAEAQECANAPASWVFCDDFESAADTTGNLGLWDEQGSTPSNLVLTSDPARVRAGKRSLEITAHKGSDTGGGPTKWFLPGHDEVYLRFWVRFSDDYNYAHHLVFLGANSASNKWSAFGTAGCRPSGSNFFTTQIDAFSTSPPPGAWGFYTYSTDMTCDPGSSCSNYANPSQICDECAAKGSPCENGLECCWGSNRVPSPVVPAKRGVWTCIEARVAANTGGLANGSESLFVDDQLAGTWSGIRFRGDDTLKINALGLWHYVTDDVYGPGKSEQTVWFDDVVISTERVGCGNGPITVGDGGSGSMSQPPTGAQPPAAQAAAAAPDAGAGARPANGEAAGAANPGSACGVASDRSGAAWSALLLVAIAAMRRRIRR